LEVFYIIFDTYRQVVTLFLILTDKLLLYFGYLQASCYLISDTSKVNAGQQGLNSAYVGACGRLDCRTNFFYFTFGLQNLEEKNDSC